MIQWTKFLTLVLSLVIILAVAIVSLPVIADNINLGIDLQGGVYVLLEAQPPQDGEQVDSSTDNGQGLWQRITGWFDGLFRGDGTQQGGSVSAEDMAATIAVLSNRVDSFGLAEPIIQQEGNDRIRIELATDPSDPEQSQTAILETIGRTAQLEFRDAEGETVLTGANLRNAQAVFQTDEMGRNSPMVALEFDREGAEIFAELTRSHIGQPVPIYLDGEVISAPMVQNEIRDGEAVITGSASIDEAAELANLLRSGALPLELVQLEVRTVGPLLGADSLSRSLYAGVIGLALLFVFLIAFYRVPGIITSFVLLAYVVLVLAAMVGFNAVLTLPGIAGIILTTGMAVDANVIIFERFKEELHNGKSPRASAVSGHRKSLSTIVDANLTTLIAAAILFWLGTGPVRGFAVTLAIGIIISMLTALLLTRLLMSYLVNSNVVKRKWLLGVNK